MEGKNKLSDSLLEKVNGGLGGADEATCPKCGDPMRKVNSSFGSPSWVCDKCKETQFMSDLEYIQVLKAAEAAGQTQGLVYPIWWDKVKQ